MKARAPRVVDVEGGIGARLQLALLRLVSWTARPVGQRGVHRVAWRLGRAFPGRNAVTVDLAIGRMRIRLSDGYGVKFLARGYRYEPELHAVLSAAVSQGAYFIDGGANLGYWSIAASHWAGTRGRVVAVEAVRALFDGLVENARLNDDRFACHHGALWSTDGEELTIVTHAEHHAGSSVVNWNDRKSDAAYSVEPVPTVTLDALADRYCTDGDRPVTVKLDIEGAEIPALEGAGRLLAERLPLVVFEDHGSDPVSRVSSFFLSELGYSVYRCLPNGRLSEMNSVAEIGALKNDPGKGYNFVAHAPGSEFGRRVVGRLTG